jgi:hypothetical protein
MPVRTLKIFRRVNECLMGLMCEERDFVAAGVEINYPVPRAVDRRV